MKIVDLESRPDLRASVLALIEREFPKGEAQARPLPFEDEFGALLKDNAPARILAGVIDETTPVAAMAWKSFELKSGLKVAGVGLVVTDKDHRKKGHSRALVAEVEARARGEGCAIIVLWSELIEFYSKLGYVLAGSEISWDLEEDALTEDDGPDEQAAFGVREAALSDVERLVELYSKDPVGPKREGRTDFERQLRQSDALALVAEDRDQNVVAYALAGKGRDLRHVVHEIVGDANAFAALVSRARAALGAASFEADFDELPPRLQFPYAHPSLPELENLFAEGEQGAVCFAKVLDTPSFVAAIGRELVAQGMEGLSIRYDEEINAWMLSDAKQDIFLSPDPAHLLQIFCSPWGLEDLEGLPGRTLKRLEDWKPYPLYFWGMDSV